MFSSPQKRRKMSRAKPAFVDINGFPVGRGDFVLFDAPGVGVQMARVHHWMSPDRCRVYKLGRGGWSRKLSSLDKDRIINKKIKLGEAATRDLVLAPRIEGIDL
jgi:hypothetical protein